MLPKRIKHILLLVCFSFLIVNCHQTDSAIDKSLSLKVDKPIISSNIDSVKFKSEIFRIDTLFETLYKTNAFNGNVLIAKGNSVIYKKSFGYSIKETNCLLNDSSVFQLASISKVITSIGILLLYEQEKLKLDDKVSDVLVGFPYKNITIKHLLSHRSGLPNYTYFCDNFINHSKTSLSNQDVLEMMITHKPQPYFNEGLRFNYSNTNYLLLALIIEKISKKSYADFMNTTLFVPLGMKNTCVFDASGICKPNFTHGYTCSFKKIEQDRYDGVFGDKGIYTTTQDLFLLSAALYQHTLLSKQTQLLAYTPHSPEKKQSNYGLGWRMKNMTNEDKEVFHNGWWHGYRTSFHRRFKDSLTIIVLSNRLNKSVYSTWRIYQAIDGTESLKNKDEE